MKCGKSEMVPSTALSQARRNAALFFGSLLPLAVKQESTWLLPAVFGIGSALPVLVFGMLLTVARQPAARHQSLRPPATDRPLATARHRLAARRGRHLSHRPPVVGLAGSPSIESAPEACASYGVNTLLSPVEFRV